MVKFTVTIPASCNSLESAVITNVLLWLLWLMLLK